MRGKEFILSKFLRVIGLTLLLVTMFSTVNVFASPDQEKASLEAEHQEVLTQIQVAETAKSTAHGIAEDARSLGLPEEDPIIQRAKQLWSENNNKQAELNTRLSEINARLDMLKKYEYVGVFKLTGYCNCTKCCGQYASGKTASGTWPQEGRTVAASKQFPLGTKLYIEGLGEYIVEDRGGFASNVIDMYSNTHSGCYRAEYNQNAKVYVIND